MASLRSKQLLQVEEQLLDQEVETILKNFQPVQIKNLKTKDPGVKNFETRDISSIDWVQIRPKVAANENNYQKIAQKYAKEQPSKDQSMAEYLEFINNDEIHVPDKKYDSNSEKIWENGYPDVDSVSEYDENADIREQMQALDITNSSKSLENSTNDEENL